MDHDSGRPVKSLLDPLGLQKIAGLHKPFESLKSPLELTELANLGKAIEQAGAPLRMMQDVLAAEALKASYELRKGLSLSAEQAAASAKLLDHLRPAINTSTATLLEKQLADLLPPSAALLGAGFEKPAVLA